MTEKKRPGRQPLGDTVNACIAMPRDLHERLKEHARQREMTASAVVRLAVRQSLAASAAPAEDD